MMKQSDFILRSQLARASYHATRNADICGKCGFTRGKHGVFPYDCPTSTPRFTSLIKGRK